MAFEDYIFLFNKAADIAQQVNNDVGKAQADDGKVDGKEAAGIAIKGLLTLFAMLAPILLKK